MTDISLDRLEPAASSKPRAERAPRRVSGSAGLGEIRARYLTRPLARAMPFIVAAVVVAALIIGWLQRDEGHLTPESGIGYWLGITGGSAMLLLLVYPMRKRMPRLRFLGSVPFWFRTHMLLGIVGPLLIVYHSNFKLGALNSNVAFISMLIVAISGVLGRYIYSRIHLGLYGRKASVAQLLDDAAGLRGAVGSETEAGVAIAESMRAFAELAMRQRSNFLAGGAAMLLVGLRGATLRARLTRDIDDVVATEGKRLRWSRAERRHHARKMKDLVRLYFVAIRKAARFAFYERIFALWHVLHLPLFILLILAAAIHILAVHLY